MKKTLILCLCLLLNTFPAQAKTTSTILLYGDELSTILILTIQDEKVSVLSIPNNIVLPITCANKNAALWTITNEDSLPCLKTSIEQAFQISIDHSLYLHTNVIDQDFPQALQGSDLKNVNDITAYFGYLASQASVSLLWKYKDYIETDLSLWQLKDYYPIFTDDDLTMEYHYLHLIGNQGYWFALDRTAYRTQE